MIRKITIFLAAALLGATNVFAQATILTQDDFKYGTYIIDTPGVYKLGEDISFNPNSPETLTEAVNSGLIPPPIVSALGLTNPVTAYHAGFPLFTQFTHGPATSSFTPGGPLDQRYDPAGYGIGFFAAISITADDVILDLNGYRIEQSEEHALFQRFFAVIELADKPFIPNQGPFDFGDVIDPAKNVVIKKGTIGRSAHHGVHGNGNENVKIRYVNFEDYEVAAVALNGVQGLKIRYSNATNRKDVPILGTFSSAQFIKPFLDELVRNGSTTTLSVDGTVLSAADVRADLFTSINNTHYDLVANQNFVDGRPQIDKIAHPDEYALYNNPFGVVDGNSYSFLTNGIGVAVNGFPTQGSSLIPSTGVSLRHVSVQGQHAFINEIIALNQNGKPVIDPVGAVFQFRNLHPDTDQPITMSSLDESLARYTGNAVANAQAFVAKAFYAGEFDSSRLDLSRLNITPEVLSWIEAEPGFETLDSIVQTEQDYFCNGDSMFHVNKGVIAYKLDSAIGVRLYNTHAYDVKNFGEAGSFLCGDYSDGKSHPEATVLGYGGAFTRAYTFAGSSDIVMTLNQGASLFSKSGAVTGVDAFDAQDLRVRYTYIDNVTAGQFTSFNPLLRAGPDAGPSAIGYRVGPDATNVKIRRSCADDLDGAIDSIPVLDESGSAIVRKFCD